MNMFKKNGGFTLVELIVVIAILAILAGIAIPAYSGYITKANDASVVTQLGAVSTAAMGANAKVGEVESIVVGADGSITITPATSTAEGSDFYTFYGASAMNANVLKGTSYAGGATWTPDGGWVPGVADPE